MRAFASKLAPTGVLALLSFAAVASPQLSLSLNKTETQLGKPVRAELVAVATPQKLASLDLQPLQDAFGVVVVESATNVSDPRWPGAAVQLLRLRLYPRRTGELTLPALHLGEAHSQARTVHVLDGSRGGVPIGVVTHLSTSSPWERQQVVLQLEITTPQLFATIEAADKLQVPGVDIVPLPRQREQRQVGATKVAVLRLGWALALQTAGTHYLELPPIRYNVSGRTERIYYFPTSRLQVRPLPPYIPPTLPVGKVAVSSSLSPTGSLTPNNLAYWTVTVGGTTVSPRDLPPVLRQIQSTAGLRFLTAAAERSQEAQASEVRSRVVYQIPFKPLASGPLALPTLQLQYFDPATGRLVRVNHRPPRPWVLSPAWRVTLISVSGLLVLWLCVLFYRRLHSILQRRRQRTAARAALREATDAWQLRRALAVVARAEGFPGNLSLREWARHWRARHRTDPAFDDLMARLSRACYGKPAGQEDAATLKAAVDAVYRGQMLR
jgi:hypothetical protein